MRSFLRAGLTALGLWVLSTVAAFAICGAAAGGCFWVPLAVSGAVSGTGSVCRLTVLNTAGLVSGTSVIVAGLVGATECNGTTTVSTVVDGTHLELAGTTFTSVYVSGGTVAGGQWTATSAANWASTTGGTGNVCLLYTSHLWLKTSRRNPLTPRIRQRTPMPNVRQYARNAMTLINFAT